MSQLDTVLVCLWANQTKRLFFNDIAEFLKDDEFVAFGDIGPILKQLEKDEFIEYDDRAIGLTDVSLTNRVYRITFQGRFWTERGGYLGGRQRQDAESIRNEKLEKTQMALQKWLVWLTAILVVGTTIAALYYATELYWNHGWFRFGK